MRNWVNLFPNEEQFVIRLVGRHNKAGVLLIVKNYTGDRLNFGLAAKRAQLEGMKVEMVLVDDDWALDQSKNESVGRRGLCGTVFIEKIAGALAEQRKSLNEIKETLDYILKNNRLRTIGVSLAGRVDLPGETSQVASVLESNKIEIGLGIHGEPGKKREQITKSKELVSKLFDGFDLFANYQSVCLMVNNLGGLSNLELYLLFNDCIQYIQSKRPDTQVKRVYCGTLMTSLNMNGFSVTVLGLDEQNSEIILDALDAKTSAPAWPKLCAWDLLEQPFDSLYTISPLASAHVSQLMISKGESFVKLGSDQASLFKFVLKTISEDLIAIKDSLNELDEACGDGDCGNSLSQIGLLFMNSFTHNSISYEL